MSKEQSHILAQITQDLGVTVTYCRSLLSFSESTPLSSVMQDLVDKFDDLPALMARIREGNRSTTRFNHCKFCDHVCIPNLLLMTTVQTLNPISHIK